MTQIRVNELGIFEYYEEVLRDAESELQEIASEIQAVKVNLRFNMMTKSYTRICNSIDNTKQSVENCNTKIRNLETGAEEIRNKYYNTECRIYDFVQGENLNTIEVSSNVTNMPNLQHTAGGEGMGGRGNGPDDSEIISWWSKVASLFGKQVNSELIGVFSGGMGLLSSWLKLTEKEYTSYTDVLKDFTGSLKGVTGFTSGVLKLLGDKKAAGEVGILSSVLGTVKELIGACGLSVEEQLKNSGGLITSGASLGTTIYGFAHPKYFAAVQAFKGKAALYTEKVGNIAAISAGFTMITRGIGDVISFSKDGDFTLSEFGQVALDTGIHGADSLVSGLTLGLVDIDTDFAAHTFQNNTNAVSQWIHDTGLPVEAQVALAFVSSPAVAVASAAEIAADTLSNTVENVCGLFKWVGSFWS